MTENPLNRGAGVARAQPRRADGGRPAVLVVDDVEANLVAAEALLVDLGCDVVLAKSSNEALRQLLRREFAVALLDLRMPQMDGYEVAHHARQNPATRDLPIVFLTAKNDAEGGVLSGYGSGAVDVLFKPIDSTILRSKVRVFLDLYRNRRDMADAKSALEETHAALETAYRDLQTTQAQLVQLAKMASLGELVAGIAHEINNPLAFAVSHLDTARRSLGNVGRELGPTLLEGTREHWDRADSRLREMSLGLERIRELVLELRTFSRLDEGERKRVSVTECVESVVTILRHRLKEGVSVETHFGAPDELDCYPGLLNQALMNLISNAIDAIDNEGKVVIRTGELNGEYRISVADTGPVIPAPIRERIFEPFFTTKPVGKGTGLGLSITHSIVEKHGGKLTLDCPAEGGTRMTIELPMSEKAGS